jgi:hypothetical protein
MRKELIGELTREMATRSPSCAKKGHAMQSNFLPANRRPAALPPSLEWTANKPKSWPTPAKQSSPRKMRVRGRTLLRNEVNANAHFSNRSKTEPASRVTEVSPAHFRKHSAPITFTDEGIEVEFKLLRAKLRTDNRSNRDEISNAIRRSDLQCIYNSGSIV